MRKVKNITVCVSPEIYRQTRHLAAEYDSTVSTIVAWLLERLPAALERSHFPKGGPKPSLTPAPTAVSPSIASGIETVADNPVPVSHSTIRAVKLIEKMLANSACKTVKAPLTNHFSAACSQSVGPVTVPVKLYDGS